MRSLKQRILQILIFCSIITLGQSLSAAPVVFENFSNNLNLHKFTNIEQAIQLDTINQDLKISLKGSAFTRNSRNNNLVFANQNIDFIQADLKIKENVIGSPSTQRGTFGLGGNFYNSALGLIAANIELSDRGNGLEAYYLIFQYDASNNIQSVISNTLSSGPLLLNTTYTLSISYDGNNTFTYIFNNESPVIVTAPTKATDTTNLYKYIGTWMGFGQDFNTGVSKPDDGSTVSISMTVDNVITSATAPALLDDFSGANLDTSKWYPDEGSTEIINNQLVMNTTNQGTGRTTQRLNLRKTDYKTIGAKVTLLNSSIVPSGPTRIRGGILHVLGNDTFKEENGDVFNGNENDIFTFMRLRRDGNGSFRAEIYASKVTSSDFSTESQLFYQVLSPPVPVTYDQAYALEIEQINTLVNYKMDGVTYFSFDLSDNTTYPALTGNIYPASNSAFTQVQTRVQDGPGEAHVIFDDIITDDENRRLFTRAEIAKPLLQTIHGKAYIPPNATGMPYDDVDAGDFNADWIEQLKAEGITEGCDTAKFCPNMIVTKEQLSKLLLKTKNGSSFMPSSPTGTVFNDVPLGTTDANWIEELANQAISAGCDTDNFCSHEAATISTFEAMLTRASY